MKLETAISLLGVEDPWQIVSKSDFAGYFSDDHGDDGPWFAMNRQETIQFRVLERVIDAVFLNPSEVEEFDMLREQLPNMGFKFERHVKIAVDANFSIDSEYFIRDKVRVEIPRKIGRPIGFEIAVCVERVS